ncbi:MAG: hypothetical protein JWM45_3384, partial [Pseudonocardiales bacterium]|nr:hypothetical protein [Pseudonocardiales bacterium]
HPSFGEAALLGEQLVDRGSTAGIPGADLGVEGVDDLLHFAAPLRYRRLLRAVGRQRALELLS